MRWYGKIGIFGFLFLSIPLFSEGIGWFSLGKFEGGGRLFLFENQDTLTPAPYHGLGLNFEIFYLNNQKKKWGWGYGVYFFVFL
mgnify:FL=1